MAGLLFCDAYELRRICAGLFFVVSLIGAPANVFSQIMFEHEPILYSQTPVSDPVSQLQKKLDAGDLKLKFTEGQGYLPAVLDALGVSPESQMLVFSKTSFQLRRISPRTPRALYFNDDVYIGWVPNGDVIEVSAVDPKQGAIFYTLDQDQASKPKFIRDKGNCMTCHASSRTQGVPSHLVRSVYPSASGHPHFGAGTFRTNHASPFAKRWGGWYVSGTHGKQRHMGNAISKDRYRPEDLDVEAGANVKDLSGLVNLDGYVSRHSDIVALMVLEHQTEMHNLITLASFETRSALHHGAVMNKALERDEDFVSESTRRRINNVADKVVKYMLFCEEFPLTDPVAGTSQFAVQFAKQGRRDKQGRSLRDFDLQRRIFKHPCSYLIYSDSFVSLPPPVKESIYRRLLDVLSGTDQSDDYDHLSSADRRAILEILRDTHPDLPSWFKEEA